jgi:hypothetical protein
VTGFDSAPGHWQTFSNADNKFVAAEDLRRQEFARLSAAVTPRIEAFRSMTGDTFRTENYANARAGGTSAWPTMTEPRFPISGVCPLREAAPPSTLPSAMISIKRLRDTFHPRCRRPAFGALSFLPADCVGGAAWIGAGL